MQKIAWNIREFRKLVEKRLSSAEFEEIKSPLGSIPWKYFICQYHIEEYKKILKEPFTGDINNQLVQAVGKVIKQSAGTDEGNQFSVANFKAEAHVIAFAQSLHSTSDIFAKVLCISLDLDSCFIQGKKSKTHRYLKNVQEVMKKNNIATEVSKSIDIFMESKEFKYLRDYVNMTKHQSLISSEYSIQLQEKCHGMRLSPFKGWPYKWADDFTGEDFERLSNMFGAIGCALNKYIESLTDDLDVLPDEDM